MSIEEYIVENDIVEETIKVFKKPEGSVGMSSRGMIKNLLDRMLNNDEVQLRLVSKKIQFMRL